MRSLWTKCSEMFVAPTFSGFVNVWFSSVELLEGQSLGIKFSRFIWNEEEFSKRFRDYRNHRLAKVYLNMVNTRTKMYWLARISLSSTFWKRTYLVYQKLKATKSFPSSPVRVWIFFFLWRFGPLSGHDLHLSRFRDHTQTRHTR